MTGDDLRARLERFVEHHVLHGVTLPIAALCEDRPEFAGPLQALVDRYLQIEHALDSERRAPSETTATSEEGLPSFDGFRTIERIGGGGTGDVYKLQDLTLGRIVAAKILKPDAQLVPGLSDFLREARALALFSDSRIVRLFEFRADARPPVLVMEYVAGFELDAIGPSLEFHQRARVMKDVCEAVQHAHALGLVHRDLKPSNIMLDARLSPKILDFGLSQADPGQGHFLGTPRYLAPEQLDRAQPIDARTDVYALGVVLYELLCGVPPYGGSGDTDVLAAIRTAAPRLPVEVDPRVPEPLQAIALKAMERRPDLRYASAKEMALDLARHLDGRPVEARPTQYASALGTRVRPHLAEIENWERLRLVYPHEAAQLRSAYRALDAREEDWIVESRTLSFSQIALYLGAFLLMYGSLFYFGAHRFYEAVRGLARPFIVLALPFAGINLAGYHLFRREHKAVAVAFFLGGVSLLPLFLLIAFHETRIWVVPENTPGQLFQDGSISNRQLQVTVLAAALWSGWLALRTRTAALSTVFGVVGFLFTVTVLADLGLRDWIEETRPDRFALHVLPLVVAYGVLGQAAERTNRGWLARPLFVGAVLVFVFALELLTLEGRAFEYLCISMRRFQRPDVSDPLLLDTLTAMTIAGIVFYLTARAIARHGSDLKSRAAWILFSLSPFAMLAPFAWLVRSGEYGRAFDWVYLGLAVGTSLLSHERQRRSFYYAGMINTAVALWFIADHHEWLDQPAWAISLIGIGLAVLAAGFGLAARERRRSKPGGPP